MQVIAWLGKNIEVKKSMLTWGVCIGKNWSWTLSLVIVAMTVCSMATTGCVRAGSWLCIVCVHLYCRITCLALNL